MEILYRGFDGLDVSFKAHAGPSFLAELADAKAEAQRLSSSVHMKLSGSYIEIFETGSRGGYCYKVSTGRFGATWFFKKPNKADPWGIRVSCNSFFLATSGLGLARSKIIGELERFGVSSPQCEESIGRIDYAIDFLAPRFELKPENFVMHSNAIRSDHMEHYDQRTSGRSGRCTSVTVGKMPGRQVIIYDKRAEIIAKQKPAWWDIWNASRNRLGQIDLEREDAQRSRVWRIEIRAGKRHLKDDWRIKTWSDLDCRLGDMIAATLNAIRYCEPNSDSNRSRWPDHEIWEQARIETDGDLFEMRNYADPDLVKLVQKEAFNQLLEKQMLGLLTTLAASAGVSSSQLSAFAKELGQGMADKINRNRQEFDAKLDKANARYQFI